MTRQTWVLASSNKGKLAEFNTLLQEIAIEVIPQTDFNLVDAVEDGLSFIENAIIKARWASKHTGLPALADDSGLAVDALNGAPGIYSARYAGPNASDADNNALLVKNLQQVDADARSAQFHCVLAFVRHASDPVPIICHGIWRGQVLSTAIGDNGFGYDPLFFIPELGLSSAQLSKTEKSNISHRAQAMAQFKQAMGLV